MSETRELERDLRKGLKVSKEDIKKKRSRLGNVLKSLKNLVEILAVGVEGGQRYLKQ